MDNIRSCRSYYNKNKNKNKKHRDTDAADDDDDYDGNIRKNGFTETTCDHDCDHDDDVQKREPRLLGPAVFWFGFVVLFDN